MKRGATIYKVRSFFLFLKLMRDFEYLSCFAPKPEKTPKNSDPFLNKC